MEPRKTALFPRLKILRHEANLSISALAERADVSRDSISKIEHGQPVTLVVAHRVLRALAEVHRDLQPEKELLVPAASTERPRGRIKKDQLTIEMEAAGILRAAPKKSPPLEEFSIPLPMRMIIEIGTANSEDLGELFHELSTLYQMVGGSGLSFYFEETREVVQVPA